MDFKKAYENSKQLDEKTLAVAKKELNEKDPKQMAADIQYIKDWIKKEDYMNVILDDDFILAFLRAAKYSYTRAQELIRNYWTNRTELPEWFKNRNFDDDSVTMEIADLAPYIKLPFPDKEGRVIILQRMTPDPEKYDFNDFIKYSFACLDIICQDPRVQINGITSILDMSDMTARHATEMTPTRAQKMMKCFQDAYPLRTKSINYYKYPKIFDAVFPIVKMFMKEKIKKRLNFHGSDLKSLHKEIPKSVLPKEYGGDLGSINEISKAWVEHVLSQKKYLLDMQNYGVDLARVPKMEKDSASKAAAGSEAVAGVTGTFRKLNVD